MLKSIPSIKYKRNKSCFFYIFRFLYIPRTYKYVYFVFLFTSIFPIRDIEMARGQRGVGPQGNGMKIVAGFVSDRRFQSIMQIMIRDKLDRILPFAFWAKLYFLAGGSRLREKLILKANMIPVPASSKVTVPLKISKSVIGRRDIYC